MRTAPMCLLCLVAALPLCGQEAMPIEFDRSEAWKPQPTWLANPATDPGVKAAEGVATFTIREPRLGMKWRAEIKPFRPLEAGYLVVRYKAESVLGGADYFLWAFDGSKDGHQVASRDALRSDGQWHVLAADVWAAGVTGTVTALALQVQAGEKVPAALSLDYIRHVEEPPPDADRYPKQTPAEMNWQQDLRAVADWQQQPSWLGNGDAAATLKLDDGVVTMAVPAAGKGMKWSHRYPQPVDLAGARYVAIRYRARHVAPHGDYFVYAGGKEGQQAKSVNLMPLTAVNADGAWHVYIGPIRETMKMSDMAIQCQAAATEAWAAIDYVRFSNRPLLVPIGDAIAHSKGHEQATLKPDRARTIDLSAAANAAIKPCLRALSLAGWFEGDALTIEGVPFALATGAQNVVATPPGTTDPAWTAVGQRATEAYLLIAALLPAEDYSGMEGARPLARFGEPERFVIRVRYADGQEDLCLPVRVRANAYEVLAGVDLYALLELRDAVIERIGLECRMASGRMLLAGLTLNTGDALLRPPAVAALPPEMPPRMFKPREPEFRLEGWTIAVETATLAVEFSTKEGVTLHSLRNRCAAGAGAREEIVARGDCSLFELGAGGTVLTSDKVKVTDVRKLMDAEGVVLDVDARPAVPIAGSLRITAERFGHVRLELTVRNVSDQVLRPVVNFPTVERMTFGDIANTWYFYPQQGGVINRVPATLREVYSGRFPMQLMGLFNPQLDAGVYLQVCDDNDIYKYFVLRKDDKHVAWRVEYFASDIQPGQQIPVAAAMLNGNTGGWRAQLDTCRSQAKPLVPRKDWFRDIYNYRQHLVRGGLYDFTAKQYRMLEAVAADREFFGRVDYLHIFDFGESPTFGRVGDYCHYDEIGGREKLAAAIAQVKADGVPVGLYIEGYLCDERGQWGREHVADGHIIQQNGQPLLWPGAPTEHMMCAWWPTWQDYLASVYKRVAGELSPSGMYIDQHGFGNEWKICWSGKHGHPVPWPPIASERELCRKVRQAVPPEIATLTEETPTDVNSRFQDGALGYSVAFNDPVLAPHRADLFRFVFPDFKVFQLVSYNPFIEGGWSLLKFPFFNGEGTWLCQNVPDGFDAAAREFLRKAFAILHEHREAFRSESPRPLVPTASAQVFANEFGGKAETVWTLYNGGYRTHRGAVLSVRHAAGAAYRDLWNGVDLKPRIENGQAVLEITIGPREVGCVVQTRP